jgi:aminopeptidase N
VTFDDQLVFTSRVTRGARVQRAIVVAHEMAHQWFGNLTTPVWWDDLWLNESFAQYMGVRVAAEATEFSDAWLHDSYETRQWGLTADQSPSTHPVGGNGARDAATALQDFDGISYVKGASVLRQLNNAMGDEVFFRGLAAHFTRHRFGNATMHDLVTSWEGAGAGSLSTFVPNWLRTAGADTLTYDRAAGLVRRTPPNEHPADRSHTFKVAVADQEGEWATIGLTVRGPETPLKVSGDAVLLDPYDDTWAVTEPDMETMQALKHLLPRTTDPRLRAGVWNNVRSAFHNAAINPADVLDLLDAGMPLEDSDDAVSYTMGWAIRSLPVCASDPGAVLDRLHDTAMAALPRATEGSTLQLAAFQAAVTSCLDADRLRSWLDGTDRPSGITMDVALRWRILVRLAALGAIDRDELANHLATERTARSQVEHVRALAALPDEEAKTYAWRCFTGEVDVPNHELEAAGGGMWQVGQESLTEPYVERYAADLPGTAGVRSGWMLAETARAFFPATSVRRSTVDRMSGLADEEDLEPSLRRAVVDTTDELRRLLAVRERYGPS